jgi:hypothetical protein
MEEKYKFVLYRVCSITNFLRFGGRRILFKELKKMEETLNKDQIEYTSKRLKNGYKIIAYSENKDYLMDNYNEMQTFLTNPLESFKDFTDDKEYLKKVTQNKYIKGKMDFAFALGYAIVSENLRIKTLCWVEDSESNVISKK